jgi:hypothetical protein
VLNKAVRKRENPPSRDIRKSEKKNIAKFHGCTRCNSAKIKPKMEVLRSVRQAIAEEVSFCASLLAYMCHGVEVTLEVLLSNLSAR